MPEPVISVIIIYTHAGNLKECIESALQQSFSNIEAVCVNNGSKDSAEKTVCALAEKIDRIKLVSIPAGISSAGAKRAGLAAASGAYAVFIENNEVLPPDFMKTIYKEAQENEPLLKNKYLYKRSFIDSRRDLSLLVSEAAAEAEKEIEKKFQEKLSNFCRLNTENMQNSAYELSLRLNQLEKLFYDKEWQLQELIKNVKSELNAGADDKISKIYEDISRVYDYINAEKNQRGSEINKVYEEITKNYKYTEKTAEESAEKAFKDADGQTAALESRISALEKEIILRYQNLKRVMDIRFDEADKKTDGG